MSVDVGAEAERLAATPATLRFEGSIPHRTYLFVWPAGCCSVSGCL